MAGIDSAQHTVSDILVEERARRLYSHHICFTQVAMFDPPGWDDLHDREIKDHWRVKARDELMKEHTDVQAG